MCLQNCVMYSKCVCMCVTMWVADVLAIESSLMTAATSKTRMEHYLRNKDERQNSRLGTCSSQGIQQYEHIRIYYVFVLYLITLNNQIHKSTDYVVFISITIIYTVSLILCALYSGLVPSASEDCIDA